MSDETVEWIIHFQVIPNHAVRGSGHYIGHISSSDLSCHLAINVYSKPLCLERNGDMVPFHKRVLWGKRLRDNDATIVHCCHRETWNWNVLSQICSQRCTINSRGDGGTTVEETSSLVGAIVWDVWELKPKCYTSFTEKTLALEGVFEWEPWVMVLAEAGVVYKGVQVSVICRTLRLSKCNKG